MRRYCVFNQHRCPRPAYGAGTARHAVPG